MSEQETIRYLNIDITVGDADPCYSIVWGDPDAEFEGDRDIRTYDHLHQAEQAIDKYWDENREWEREDRDDD